MRKIIKISKPFGNCTLFIFIIENMKMNNEERVIKIE